MAKKKRIVIFSQPNADSLERQIDMHINDGYKLVGSMKHSMVIDSHGSIQHMYSQMMKRKMK